MRNGLDIDEAIIDEAIIAGHEADDHLVFLAEADQIGYLAYRRSS